MVGTVFHFIPEQNSANRRLQILANLKVYLHSTTQATYVERERAELTLWGLKSAVFLS